MRNWGIIITAFYAFVVTILIVPGFAMLFEGSWRDGFVLYHGWLTWVWVGILVGSQAVLLVVSVDSSWKRLKPRQHILVSLATIVLLLGLLLFAAVWSLLAGVLGDEIFEGPLKVLFGSQLKILAWWFGLWLLW